MKKPKLKYVKRGTRVHGLVDAAEKLATAREAAQDYQDRLGNCGTVTIYKHRDGRRLAYEIGVPAKCKRLL